MEELIKILPLIISALVVPALAFVRAHIHEIVPNKYIPVLLPVGAAVLGAVANLVGVDAVLLSQLHDDPSNPSLLQTVITATLSGLAATGIHQIRVQTKKTT